MHTHFTCKMVDSMQKRYGILFHFIVVAAAATACNCYWCDGRKVWFIHNPNMLNKAQCDAVQYSISTAQYQIDKSLFFCWTCVWVCVSLYKWHLPKIPTTITVHFIPYSFVRFFANKKSGKVSIIINNTLFAIWARYSRDVVN